MNFLNHLPLEIIHIIVNNCDTKSVINLSSVNSKYNRCVLHMLNIYNRVDKLEYIYKHSRFHYRRSSKHKFQLLKFAKSIRKSVVIGIGRDRKGSSKLILLLQKAANIFELKTEVVKPGRTYLEEDIYGLRVFR